MAGYEWPRAFFEIPPGGQSMTFTMEGMKPVEDADLEGLFHEVVITAVIIDGERHELGEPIPLSELTKPKTANHGKRAIIQFCGESYTS